MSKQSKANRASAQDAHAQVSPAEALRRLDEANKRDGLEIAAPITPASNVTQMKPRVAKAPNVGNSGTTSKLPSLPSSLSSSMKAAMIYRVPLSSGSPPCRTSPGKETTCPTSEVRSSSI